jgi:hypothetical protein
VTVERSLTRAAAIPQRLLVYDLAMEIRLINGKQQPKTTTAPGRQSG